MKRSVELEAGECEIISRLATQAISEDDLTRREEKDAHSVRQKIANSECRIMIGG